MRRSKELKQPPKPLWPTLIGGRYQPPQAIRLFAREGDGDGGAGGDGTTPAGEGDALSAVQVTAINNIVHKAIGSRLSSQSFKDSIGVIAGTAASEAITAASGGIAEQVAATLAAGGAGGGGGEGDPPAPTFKDSAEYKAVMKRQEDNDAALEKIKDERQAEVDGRMRTEERSALETALRAGGVEEVKLRGCVATLLHEDKVMQRDSNGAIIYRINRGEYHDELGVTEGVADFLGTDEGKTYLPATGARGTGAVGDSTNSGNNQQRPGVKQTKAEAAQVVSDFMSGNLTG